MSNGINKAFILGNLGADPDIRYSAQGTAVANISVATSESWKDKNTGEQQEKTEWHRVVFFARLAEVVAEYLHKGSKVFVEGRIQTNKWQDNNGNDRYSTQIVANEMQMLDNRGGRQESTQGNGQGNQNPYNAAKNGSPQKATTGDSLDDDIPF